MNNASHSSSLLVLFAASMICTVALLIASEMFGGDVLRWVSGAFVLISFTLGSVIGWFAMKRRLAEIQSGEREANAMGNSMTYVVVLVVTLLIVLIVLR